MPGFDATAGTELEKLLAAPPKPPADFKDRLVQGFGPPQWKAFINKRTEWVEKVVAAGGDLDQAAKALNGVHHPVTKSALYTIRRVRGHIKTTPRTPKAEKVSKSETDAIATLIHDLVSKHVAPLHAEIARLQKVEKKYNALKKLLGEDNS